MTANSFGSRATLKVGDTSYEIHRLDAVTGSADLPFSLKVLLENLLRTEDGRNVTPDHITAIARWDPAAEPDTEIQFSPARVIMQDLTGVPAVVDLAVMREAMAQLGGDAGKINPLVPAELVIDHSVIADVFGSPDAFQRNVDLEFSRNHERFAFLRWGQDAFSQFKVVPPGTGIVHQVNIEHLARVVMTQPLEASGPARLAAYPDTCLGTDSHTTMQNGLGVLGWGVGGIEAEAAMLGQPVSMLIPKVVGFRLTGELPSGATATDLVLTITELLRKHGVVGKFVEFHGDGVAAVPVANRATIGNMSPEFGSTCAIFPIDEQTLTYLRLTGRPPDLARAGRGLCERTGPVARAGTPDPLLRSARARPGHGGALDRRPEAPAGPGGAVGRQGPRSAQALGSYVQLDRLDDEISDTFPASDPFVAENNGAELAATAGPADQAPAGQAAAAPGGGAPGGGPPVVAGRGDAGGRHADVGRSRLGGDRRDHLLHQHLQPVGDDRGSAAGQEGGRGRAVPQALGEDDARAGLEGGHGLLRAGRAHPLPGEARLQPGRLRLHHLHRQLGPAAGGDQRGRRGQ